MTARYIPIISDIQYPLHDPKAVALAATIVADLGVDTVCIGDELDNWQTSRWVRGRAEEFDGKLGKARDEVGKLLVDLRVKDLCRSNHGNTRLENYLIGGAPALADLPEYQYEAFMRLDELGIRFHRKPFKVAPGWVAIHGDEGPASQIAGSTAMNIAKRWGVSVVCGHTHKMAIQHHHVSYGGRIHKRIFGFEVGNLMNQGKASYLKGGAANWQQGIGILVVDGQNVTPVMVPFLRGRAHFDGKTYRA